MRTAATGALKPMGISTDALAPEDAFDAWRDRYRALNEVIVSPGQRQPFAAHAEDWPLGDLLISRARAPQRRLVRSARHCAADDFDHVVLRTTRAGPMHCQLGDARVQVGAGQLFMGSFSEPSTIDYPDGAWVAAIIPRRVLADWEIEPPKPGAAMPRGPAADLLADFILSLAARLDGATTGEVPLLTEVFRSMLTSCLRGSDPRLSAAPENHAARQRAAVDRVIRREIASARLDADRLAALSGLSRATLYRLYEAKGGVAARIREMRLEKVYAALADPAQQARPINEVAEAWGFHCTASFNRAFRKAYGTTPGAVRARNGIAGSGRASDFLTWLERV
jgi:AraC-like DNA-binding protein